MDDPFEREFYRSRWNRVLPVGPHGIQPYVHTGRRSARSAAGPALRGPLAMLVELARGAITSGRRAAFGLIPSGNGAARVRRCCQ
jgi:hypothetical protein